MESPDAAGRLRAACALGRGGHPRSHPRTPQAGGRVRAHVPALSSALGRAAHGFRLALRRLPQRGARRAPHSLEAGARGCEDDSSRPLMMIPGVSTRVSSRACTVTSSLGRAFRRFHLDFARRSRCGPRPLFLRFSSLPPSSPSRQRSTNARTRRGMSSTRATRASSRNRPPRSRLHRSLGRRHRHSRRLRALRVSWGDHRRRQRAFFERSSERSRPAIVLSCSPASRPRRFRISALALRRSRWTVCSRP